MAHDEGVENVLVDGQLLLLHELENLGRALDVAVLAEPRDEPLVRYSVRLHPLLLHVAQKLQRRKLVLVLDVHPQQGVVVAHVEGYA